MSDEATTHQNAERVRAEVEELHAGLERLPYYAFLGIRPDASLDQVRDAFYRRAETLHPDRFYHLTDRALRSKIYEVYKRCAEAYRVLENAATRQAYDEGLRRGQHRYVKQEREGFKLKQPDAGITNLQAKRFFRLGLDALHGGDLKSAQLNLGFALSMEPGNEVILGRLREVEAQLGGKQGPR